MAALCLMARASEAAAPAPTTGLRVALVIGNSRYEPAVGALRNPVNDAKAMAKALRSVGFQVIEKHDVTRDDLIKAMIQFRARLKGAEVGMFYFAGHGIAVGGVNYLLPIRSGYQPDDLTDADLRLLAETKLFDAEQAVADMSTGGTTCSLVILDACRSTPAARNAQTRQAGGGGGLAEMNPPAGSLIAFATEAGRTASDGGSGNGLYTGELIRNLTTPGLTIEQVFKRTRAAVMQRSDGNQVPAEYSRLIGDDIYLAGPARTQTATPPGAPVARGESVAHAPEANSAGGGAAPPPAATASAAAQVPTLAELNQLAATGDLTATVEAVQRYARGHGPTREAAAPLATLLDHVKQMLRDPQSAAANAQGAVHACDVILAALDAAVPGNDPRHTALAAKALNRKGDALLTLGSAEDALTILNSAAELAPDDGYIVYNRGRAYGALGRTPEARADFTAAAGPKFKHSAVRKLAKEALAGLK